MSLLQQNASGGGGGGAVSSVNGFTGAVILGPTNVGAVPMSLYDAKGDIIVGTGSDAAARLPVGTDGQMLVASSDAATGLAYVTPPFFAPATAGGWARTMGAPVAATTFNPPQNRLSYYPIWLRGGTLDRIAVRVTTTDATSTVRLGIYAADNDLLPTGAPILDAGTVAVSALGAASITISQDLPTGVYYLAMVKQGATGGQFAGHPGNNYALSFLNQNISDPSSGTGMVVGYYETPVAGALPSVGSLAGSTEMSFIYVRFA